MDERLRQQMEFILEADKIKHIGRQTYLSDGSRKENDAEHSFHLALMVPLLAEYANEKIDTEKAMLMALVHDIVEIYAGDTYAYDTEAAKTKRDRELKAADRIFGILPDDQGEMLRSLWEEFEACETPEARFVATLDRLQPVALTDKEGGTSWREHGVRKSWVGGRNNLAYLGSTVLADYVFKLINENVEKGNIADE